MADVRFYHLQRRTLEQALPLLLQKILERGMRAVIVTGSEERAEALNQWLWTWDSAAFLPHGNRNDGRPEDQPIWLTANIENPNNAQVLVLTDGVCANPLEAFTLVCDLFDGNDGAAVAAARNRWRACKIAGHQLTYWQQSAQGGWAQKL
jgi:DNA polymerase-3 subunit chi